MINERTGVETVGKRPFTVPEGYFDGLNQQIMQQIANQGRKPGRRAVLRRLRPLLYAAACICIAVFSVAVYIDRRTDGEQQSQYTYSDTYIEDATDYAMVDCQEIYASLLADI